MWVTLYTKHLRLLQCFPEKYLEIHYCARPPTALPRMLPLFCFSWRSLVSAIDSIDSASDSALQKAIDVIPAQDDKTGSKKKEMRDKLKKH